jgi:hypothetical protein
MPNKHAGTHVSFTPQRVPQATKIAKPETIRAQCTTSVNHATRCNHAAPRTREHIHREHEQHVKRRPAVPRQRGAVGEPHVHQDAGHLRAQRVRQTHATSDSST